MSLVGALLGLHGTPAGSPFVVRALAELARGDLYTATEFTEQALVTTPE